MQILVVAARASHPRALAAVADGKMQGSLRLVTPVAACLTQQLAVTAGDKTNDSATE